MDRYLGSGLNKTKKNKDKVGGGYVITCITSTAFDKSHWLRQRKRQAEDVKPENDWDACRSKPFCIAAYVLTFYVWQTKAQVDM